MNSNDDLLKKLNAWSKNTMVEHLGIVITEFGDDYLIGTMPVDHRTHQPMGLLHGGASAALIETLGSIGSAMRIDQATQSVVGIEINANHIRGMKAGIVTAKAKLVHGGKTSHIWQVDLTDENQKLVCTGRLTVLVVALNLNK
jgi:1,4-dihydroxy-2-naphthoyl-CoA hydrolase